MAHSGTSYLAEQLHGQGFEMYHIEKQEHFEDTAILNNLQGILRKHFAGTDYWYLDETPPQECRDDVKTTLKSYKMYSETGFKNPRLILFMPELLQVFDAKFIICMRSFDNWIQSVNHGKRGSVLWFRKLKSHYEHCVNIVKQHISRDNVHVWIYDEGNNPASIYELSEFLNKKIELPNFKMKTYD